MMLIRGRLSDGVLEGCRQHADTYGTDVGCELEVWLREGNGLETFRRGF